MIQQDSFEMFSLFLKKAAMTKNSQRLYTSPGDKNIVREFTYSLLSSHGSSYPWARSLSPARQYSQAIQSPIPSDQLQDFGSLICIFILCSPRRSIKSCYHHRVCHNRKTRSGLYPLSNASTNWRLRWIVIVIVIPSEDDFK